MRPALHAKFRPPTPRVATRTNASALEFPTPCGRAGMGGTAAAPDLYGGAAPLACEPRRGHCRLDCCPCRIRSRSSRSRCPTNTACSGGWGTRALLLNRDEAHQAHALCVTPWQAAVPVANRQEGGPGGVTIAARSEEGRRTGVVDPVAGGG